MKHQPRRLKRIVAALLAVEVLVSPLMFMMQRCPQKIIVSGVFLAVLILTLIAQFVIVASTTTDKK